MNSLVAVFALLCAVESVFCGPLDLPGHPDSGPPDPPEIPDGITPTVDPPTPSIDIGPLQPRPWIPSPYIFGRCQPRHGDWFYDDLPIGDYPKPPSSNVYYVNCKVWRPTWSSCKGRCETRENVTVTTIVMQDPVNCTCCKVQQVFRVKPNPHCLVVRTGTVYTVSFEELPQPLDKYRYTIAGRCGCEECGRTSRERPIEIDEGQVSRRPDPPATP